METGKIGRVGEDVLLERVVAELQRQAVSTRSASQGKVETYLGDCSQATVPQLFGKILLGLANFFEVLLEPPLSPLRVRNFGRSSSVGADRVLRRDENVGGRESGDEDDATVGLESELVGRG